MDKWNRDNQNAYTGVTAQRRNRRRTGTEPEEPELNPDALAARVRPVRVTEPVNPVKPVIPEEPEMPEESAVPQETAAAEETAVTEEPAAAEENAAAEETVIPEPASAAQDESAAPEEKAEAEKQEVPAESPAVQGADSRVPPEARRMAAAPYGIPGSPAKRPGTRPQTAQRRPVLPDDRRTAVRPRREGYAEIPGRTAKGIQGNQPKSRVRVGYAPGRMSEEMTQQLPAADAVRESLYARDAKAYLEKRRQPFRAENDGKRVPPDRPAHKALRVIVALLVIAGAVLTGWLFIRGGNGKDGTTLREAPQVMKFEAQNTEGLTAPVELAFSAVTGKDVEGIRLRGEGDRDLDTVATSGDNADERLWTLKMTVATGYSGTVILQVRRGEEEGWYDTGYTAVVEVGSPLGMGTEEEKESEQPAPADEEDDDYYVEEEEGTAKTGTEPEEEPETDPETAADAEPETEPDTEPESGEEELPVGELKTAVPTSTPAPEEPDPTPTPPLTAEAAPEADPGLITSTTVYTSYTKKEKAYSRPAKELIHMPVADEYTKKQLGVMTFRGDNFRRNAAAGALSAAPTELKVLWQTEAGSSRGTNQTYYGYGWTGQPVIARWSTEVRAHSNITESKIEKRALKEVIIAGMDGNIRFLDLEDGKITRNSIKLGYPMRGTPSLHTRGYPFMSVGQFARKMKAKTGKIGLRQYNLFNQVESKLIDGLDGKYHRPLNNVGSFETSALIDRESDTLIVAGTNGALYLEALDSTFDYNTGVLSISPSVTLMTSKAKGQKDTALAVESSLAAYDRYVFYADMGGILRCVDTNTLTPVWAVETGDSVMAAVAMDLTEERELNLYTANMLNNRKKGSDIQIRRYDALSGREEWCMDIGVARGKKEKADVGAKASPVIGQHALNDLVYFTVTGLSEEGREQLRLDGESPAALIALDKNTGRIIWSFGLSSRSESSPIALYDKAGNGWIVQCEQNGTVHLLDGLSGREISRLELQAEIEASPAAYNNVVVIGTTGKGTSNVFGIEVRLEQTEEGGDGNEEDSGGA